MNSLIVKKISGPEERIFSLSPYDCKRLHIKFQQGLQIISMNTKNLRLKKTNKKCRLKEPAFYFYALII